MAALKLKKSIKGGVKLCFVQNVEQRCRKMSDFAVNAVGKSLFQRKTKKIVTQHFKRTSLQPGYWAANQTIYANKVMIGSWGAIVGQKLTVGVLLGWILIPIAIIKLVMSK